MSTTAVPAPNSAAHSHLREDVLGHLWKRYPQHCLVLTDPVSRRAIDVGIVRAARHGFREARVVRSYVGLMIFLGSHFDEDPQLAWAGQHLRMTAHRDRTEAMAGLLRETTQRMEPIVGKKGEYYRRALAWAESRDADAIAAMTDSDDELRHFLRQLHRRKHDALGDVAVGDLIALARTAAVRYGLTTPPGIVVYLALMFLLGSGIDQDRFHPWARVKLAHPVADGGAGGAGATARALKLHGKAMDILRRYTRLDTLMRGPTGGG